MRKNSDRVRTFKTYISELVQGPVGDDKISRPYDLFDWFIVLLIVLNAVMVIAETFPVSPGAERVISAVETVSVCVFTLEYLLRIWSADVLYPELTPFRARVRYLLSFLALIDLAAILPFFLPFFFPVNLQALRILRLFRVLRVLKAGRYTQALATIGRVLRNKANQLLSSLLVVMLLMLVSAVFMFHIENGAQPEAFDNAFSALWWAVATLTTIGYGDIYPVTVLGRILSSVIALLGVALVAVPSGIISAGFVEISREREPHTDRKAYCPWCGKRID